MEEYRKSLVKWLCARPFIESTENDRIVALSHASNIVNKLTDGEIAALYLAVVSEQNTPVYEYGDCGDPMCRGDCIVGVKNKLPVK